MEVGTDSREMSQKGQHCQGSSGGGDRQSRDDISHNGDSMVRGASAGQWGQHGQGSISRAVEVGTDSREMTSVIMGTAWSGEHQPGSGCGDRQS